MKHRTITRVKGLIEDLGSAIDHINDLSGLLNGLARDMEEAGEMETELYYEITQCPLKKLKRALGQDYSRAKKYLKTREKV